MKPTIFFHISLLSLAISFTFANTRQSQNSTCIFVDAERSQNISISLSTKSEQPKTFPPSCDASPIGVIFERHCKWRPYHNINIRRPSSDFSLTDLPYKIGRKSDYLIDEDRVNKGAYGQVFKATHIPTGDTVAIKVIRHLNKITELKTLNEIRILMDLKDAPNFLPLRDVLQENVPGERLPVFSLVFDFFKIDKPFKDLVHELEAYQIKYFLYEALRSLEYVHSKGVLHKDIKPFNIMIDSENMKVRLIDFGLSEYYLPGFTRTTTVNTLYYKGPELLLNYTLYDYALDIWGTGTIFAEMMFKKVNFFASKVEYKPGATVEEIVLAKRAVSKGQLEAIAEVLGSVKLRQYADKYKDWMNLAAMDLVKDHKKQPWTNFINEENWYLYDPIGVDLLDKMLTYDHARRITAREALQHPYFDEVKRKLAKEE